MEIVEKTKETAMSVFPRSALVAQLGLTDADLPSALVAWFLAGSVLVVIGLSLFLMGVDLGISRVGERCGAALTARKSAALMAAVAFAIGVVVTAAEPDIQVFGGQVAGAFSNIAKGDVVFSISIGVGVFLSLGVLRTVLGVPLKAALLVFYATALAMLAFSPRAMAGVAFDSGGATTGPLTVPFILALGLGVSAVRADRDGGFGLTGIASAGPLVAMLTYAMLKGDAADAAAETSEAGAAVAAATFGLNAKVAADALHDVAVSVLPLYAMAWLMQIFLIRMTRRQMARVTVGFAEAAIGLFVFLLGVHCGFGEAGLELGLSLGGKMASGGAAWFAGVLAIALFTGAVVVCAEPAVWVLGDQVEQASGGMVRRKALLAFLAGATALAVALAVARSACGFALAWILVPGYALALAMMAFCPNIFTGIAFDSGGVASGPLTTTFVLSFTLGVAQGCGRGGDAFGVVALVAMMPLVAIQAMGIAIEARRRRAAREGEVAR